MPRHPSTEHILQFFKWDHLPEHLRGVSAQFQALASEVVQECGEGPETTACLRKLLEAKDCAVRARLIMDSE